MDKKIIIDSPWNYTLYQDDAGVYTFEVVCGTVAIYTITFLLNEQETAAWEKEGEQALRHLTYRVRDYPKEYMSRRV